MLLVWYGFGPWGVQIPARALCNALWYENPGNAEVKRMSGAISAVDDKSWWPLFRVSYNFLVGILVLGLPHAGNKRSCRPAVLSYCSSSIFNHGKNWYLMFQIFWSVSGQKGLGGRGSTYETENDFAVQAEPKARTVSSHTPCNKVQTVVVKNPRRNYAQKAWTVQGLTIIISMQPSLEENLAFQMSVWSWHILTQWTLDKLSVMMCLLDARLV